MRTAILLDSFNHGDFSFLLSRNLASSFMGNLSPVGGWTSAEFVPRENVIDKGRQRSRAVP